MSKAELDKLKVMTHPQLQLQNYPAGLQDPQHSHLCLAEYAMSHLGATSNHLGTVNHL